MPQERQSLFSIFPNPANHTLNIGSTSTSDFKLSIYTIEGKLIYQNIENHKVDISSLSQGEYFVEINSKEQLERLRFQVIR